MKKRVLFGLPLLVGLFMALLPATTSARQAHPARPDTSYNCNQSPSFECTGSQAWNSINTKGAMTVTVVDNPVGTGFHWYQKYTEVFFNDPGNTSIKVGMDKGRNCSGLHWWYEIYANGTYSENCLQSVPSGDDNYTVQLAADYESSGSHQGTDIWIYADKLNSTICFPCNISTGVGGYHVTSSLYETELEFDSFSTHVVWGGTWTENQYYNGTSWAYDSTLGSATNTNYPNQFYVYLNPNGNSDQGGQFDSCSYPSGSTCTIGS